MSSSRRLDFSNARRGQAIAVRKVVDNVRAGRMVTGVVLPTRYGKSDTMRLQAYALQGAGLVYSSLILVPGRLIQEQMVDKKKLGEMNERYNLETYRYQSIESPKYGMINGHVYFDVAPNDETFVVMTIQLAIYHKLELLEYLDHIKYKVGLPMALFVDEAHYLSDENVWGDLAQGWIDAGGVLIPHTATAERFDGLDIPGLPTINEPIGSVVTYKARSHVDPKKIWVYIYNEERIKKVLDVEYLKKHGAYVSFKDAWGEKPIILCHCQRLGVDIELTKIDIDEEETQFLSDLSESRVRDLLGKVVRDKLVIESVLKDVIKLWNVLKSSLDDCAIIIFSSNDSKSSGNSNRHAKDIDGILKTLAPNLQSVIATSTNDDNSDNNAIDIITNFQDAKEDCLIVKQMGTYGLDCPRIKIVVDLSPRRTVASFTQSLMRGATPYKGNTVFYYFTPDDVIGRALFQKLIVDEEGGAIYTIPGDLIDIIEKDKREKDKLTYIIEGSRDGNLLDTKNTEKEAKLKYVAESMMVKFPELAQKRTHNDLIEFWEGNGDISMSPNASMVVVSEPVDMKIKLKKERDTCTKLLGDIVMKIIGEYDQKEYARVAKKIWPKVKPSGYEGIAPREINDLEVLKVLKNNLIKYLRDM